MRLFRAELLKLRRRPATYVVLVVLLAILGLFYLAFALSASSVQDPQTQLQVRALLSFPAAYTIVASFILSLGGFLAVAYGASVGGAEWAWGTIRNVVARGESRTRYVVVKFVALAVVLAVGILISFVIGSLFAFAAASMVGASTGGAADAETLASLPETLARTAVGLSEEGAIGFAIATLFRSQLAGIGAGIAFYFGEGFLGLVPGLGDVVPYLPFNVAQAVVTTSGSFGGGDGPGGAVVQTLDSTTALLLAGLYLVVALGIAVLATERAQITA